MLSVKNDTSICCLIPHSICPCYAADIEGDIDQPSGDGNCSDNEIFLPDGNDAENDKCGCKNESEIGEKKYRLQP